MVRSALEVSFIATTTLVAGSAMHDHDDERHDRSRRSRPSVLSWKLAGLVAQRLAVLEDRIEHHAEHADEDHHADDQHEVVQPALVARDLRSPAACRSSWLTPGPPGRSLTASAARAPSSAQAPSRAALASPLQCAFIVAIFSSSSSVVDSSGPSRPRRPCCAAAPTQFVGQPRRSSGRTKRPTAMRSALARQLDQRAVAVAGLDPDPRPARTRPARRGRREPSRPAAGRRRGAMRSRSRGMPRIRRAAPRRPPAARARRTASPDARRAARSSRRSPSDSTHSAT